MVDAVTQLQAEINKVSSLFFGTVGELQRDGLPASIQGEPLLTPAATNYNSTARSQGFAKELLAATSTISLLVSKLPTVTPQQDSERLASIAHLQQRNRLLQQQLAQEQELANIKLELAQDLFAALAEHTLAVPHQGSS
ncbi:hypothetical protein V8C86DRAFT_2489080 [Haematococcus lacustris]|nr:hypothetical protein QJQ45_012650 [Haematococcus lacustris]KAJ9512287.1 hypothetical protein QJQ45_012936 [Haematococcus lacustris]